MKLLVICLFLSLIGAAGADKLHVISVGGTTPNMYWKITSRDLTPALTETELQIGAPISKEIKLSGVLMENTSGANHVGLSLGWAKKGNSVSLFHYEGLGETPDKEKLVACATKKINGRLSAGIGLTVTKVEGKPSTWLAGPLLAYKANNSLSLSAQPTVGSDGKERVFLMVSSNL